MKLCLCFHCLCESYDGLSGEDRELFVSLADMRELIEGLLDRGYKFSSVEDPAAKTVSITFDDGYYNNLLFTELAQEYDIPYVVFVAAYYNQTGVGFPWLNAEGQSYGEMYQFDYYSHHQGPNEAGAPVRDTSTQRPLTFDELSTMTGNGLADIGCHGYYHQPLSKGFEKYLQQEESLSMSVLYDQLGIKPDYFSLANGMYTPRVVRELLTTFTRVFTIDGMPYRPKDKVIHRMSLISPTVSGPLIAQVDRNMNFARQIKRSLRTRRRLLL